MDLTEGQNNKVTSSINEQAIKKAYHFTWIVTIVSELLTRSESNGNLLNCQEHHQQPEIAGVES